MAVGCGDVGPVALSTAFSTRSFGRPLPGPHPVLRISSSAARRWSRRDDLDERRHLAPVLLSGRVHSRERRKALAQCMNTSCTVTTMPSLGTRSCTAMVCSSAGSVTRRAWPLTRSVSSKPGTTKSRPTLGLDRMLTSVSSRLLPGRSGMAACGRPAPSRSRPGHRAGSRRRGPSRFCVPMHRKGERAMNSRACELRWGRHFLTARSCVASKCVRSSGFVGDEVGGVEVHGVQCWCALGSRASVEWPRPRGRGRWCRCRRGQPPSALRAARGESCKPTSRAFGGAG